METWNILGAGAIGGLLACQFDQCNIPVQIITKAKDKQATKHITLIHGDHKSDYEFPVYQPNDGPIEQIILTTKSYQTQEAFATIRNNLSNNPTILVLQNGMGSTDWLQQEFPEANILAGTTTHGAYRENTDTIVHAGLGNTWIGPLKQSNKPQALNVFQTWKAQGLNIEWDENIEQRLWLKLAINCAINPLTVIHNCRNGELLGNPEAMTQIQQVLQEFSDIYTAEFGTPPAADLLDTVVEVATKTAENISSMRQDYLAGRKTEIEAINGYLVRKAEQYQVDCTRNRGLLAQIQSLAKIT